MKLKLSLAALAAIGALTAQAQTLTASDVLARLETTQKNAKDLRARVRGEAVTPDASLKLDLEIQAIPSLDLVRVKFNAPDSLADNFVIVDKDKVSNYLFLTNQVTVSSRSKANVAGYSIDFTQLSNVSSSLPRDKVNLKLVSTDDTPAGRAYQIEATPKPNADLEFGRVRLWVLENGWRPYRLQSYSERGALQADLTVAEWKTNSGLSAASLRAVPRDAEVINRR